MKKILKELFNRLVFYFIFLVGILIAIGPSHIEPVESPIAKIIFVIFGSLISFFGIGLYIFYLFNEYKNLEKESDDFDKK